MPEHTLRERIRGLQSSAPGAISAFDAAEQGTRVPRNVAEPEVPVQEDIGIGKAAFSSVETAKISMLVNKIKALKGKPDLQARLAAKIKAIRDAAAARAAEE